MTPAQLLDFFPSQQTAADAIGVSQGAVSQWVQAGAIPYLRQMAIQTATRGKLKARLEDAPQHERSKVSA